MSIIFIRTRCVKMKFNNLIRANKVIQFMGDITVLKDRWYIFVHMYVYSSKLFYLDWNLFFIICFVVAVFVIHHTFFVLIGALTLPIRLSAYATYQVPRMQTLTHKRCPQRCQNVNERFLAFPKTLRFCWQSIALCIDKFLSLFTFVNFRLLCS